MADHGVATGRHAMSRNQRERQSTSDTAAPTATHDAPHRTSAHDAATSRGALIAGMAFAALLVMLVCGLGVVAWQSDREQQEITRLVQAGRQGALNLTTLDFNAADADVKRIVDSSTGAFHAQFQERSAAFIDALKQAQSKSAGTVSEAAVESYDGSHAQILVAVVVEASTAGVPEPEPRLWRMRISVQETDDGAKVSDVEFVP